MIPILKRLANLILIVCCWDLKSLIAQSWSDSLAKTDSHQAIIDLSGWNFHADGVAELKGDWQLYWGELLEPKDFEGKKILAPPILYPVPSTWSSAKNPRMPESPNHYASYHVKVRIPKSYAEQFIPLTLGVKETPGAFRLWVNGVEAIRGGQVGQSAESELAHIGKEYYSFTPKTDTLDLLMQVSNYHYKDGGMWWPLVLGEVDSMTRQIAFAYGLDCFVLSGLLLMSFYHFGLFWMRRDSSSSLLFALFCIGIAIRSLTAGFSNIYLVIIPNMSFDWKMTLEYSSFYASIPIYFSFMRTLYPLEFSMKVEKIIVGIGFVFVVHAFTTSARHFSNYLEIYQIFTVICSTYCLMALVRALLNKRHDIVLFLSGTIVVISSTVNDILQAHRISPLGINVTPFGVLLLVLLQSLVLARRFSWAFSQVKSKSEEIKSLYHSRGVMAGKASHHLNNPLMAIVGSTSQIQKVARGLQETIERVLPPEKDRDLDTETFAKIVSQSFHTISSDVECIETAIKRADRAASNLRHLSGVHGNDLTLYSVLKFWKELQIKLDDIMSSSNYRPTWQELTGSPTNQHIVLHSALYFYALADLIHDLIRELEQSPTLSLTIATEVDHGVSLMIRFKVQNPISLKKNKFEELDYAKVVASTFSGLVTLIHSDKDGQYEGLKLDFVDDVELIDPDRNFLSRAS